MAVFDWRAALQATVDGEPWPISIGHTNQTTIAQIRRMHIALNSGGKSRRICILAEE